MIRSKSNEKLCTSKMRRCNISVKSLPDLAMEAQFESMTPAGLIGTACVLNSSDILPYKLIEFPQDLVVKEQIGACLACQPDDIVVINNKEIPPKYVEMMVRIRQNRKNKKN